MGKALLGTFINGFFVSGMFLFPMVTVMKNHGYTDLGAGRTTHTCRKNGAEFSYYSNWTIEETMSGGNRAPTITARGPNETVVILIFFPPTYQEPLENYANRATLGQKACMEAQIRRSVDVRILPVIGKVGGIERPGFQSRFTSHTADGPLLFNSYYFMLSDPKHTIMVSTYAADDDGPTVDPEIALILDSLSLEGTTPPNQSRPGMTGTKVRKSSGSASLSVKMIAYKPKDACALIGNKTAMTGDVIEGFKIIAINQDSIMVQSPAGVKKSLRLGDDLK
jgi:hypothetical protein